MKKVNEALSMKLDPIQTFVAGNLIKWAIQQPQVKADSMRGGVADWVEKGTAIYPQMLAMAKEGRGFTLLDPDQIGSVHMILKWAADQPEVIRQSGPGALINLRNVADQIINPPKKPKKEEEKPEADVSPREVVPEETPDVPTKEPVAEPASKELGSGGGRGGYDPDKIVGESKRIVEKAEEENILKDGYREYITQSMKDDKFDVTDLKGFEDWVAEQAAQATGETKEEECEEEEPAKEEKEEKAEEPKEEKEGGEIKTILPTESKVEEVAPPGGEYVVKGIKKSGAAVNPWAVAWAMRKKGARFQKGRNAGKKMSSVESVRESTVAEWEADIQKLSDEERQQYVNALDTLEKWALFKSEFDWTQIFALRALLQGQGRAPSVQPTQQPAPETKATRAPVEGKVPDIGKDAEGEMVKKLMEKHGLLPTEEGKVPDIGKDTEGDMQKKLQEEAEVKVDFGNKEVDILATEDGTAITTTDKPEGEPLPEPVVEVNPGQEPAAEETPAEETPEEEAEEEAKAEEKELPFEGKVPEVGKDGEPELQKKLQEEVADNLKKWLK